MTAVLTREMAKLVQGRSAPSLKELRRRLNSRELEEIFHRWLKGQKGRVEKPGSLDRSRRRKTWKSPKSGYIAKLDAKELGLAAMALGAGRRRKEEAIDPSVGLVLRKKVGDRLAKGEVLAEIHYNDAAKLAAAWPHLRKSLQVSRRKPPERALVKAVLKNYG